MKKKSLTPVSKLTAADEYSTLLSASQKRSLIRHKKHTFNLMSLDEYVLNFYDRIRNGGEPSPSNSSSGGHHRHPNLTIHECTNESTESGGGGGGNGGAQQVSNKPKLSNLHMPHANFISLRSGGTDSLNSGWGVMGAANLIKPTRSYDYGDESLNQLESADFYTSSSLQHSQFLLPPPSLASIGPASPSPPQTHRPINPISSMRRHMFVNSRRSGAQTTVDNVGTRMNGGHGGGAYDSLISYDGSPPGFMVSASFASNSNMSYKEPGSSSSPLHTSNAVKPTTITTTKVEIINEYAVVCSLYYFFLIKFTLDAI